VFPFASDQNPEDGTVDPTAKAMDEATAENIRELYDQIQFGRLNYDRARHNPLLFDQVSRLRIDQQLYDIGCGSGYWMGRFVEAGVEKDRITGVDLSRRNVEHLRTQGFRARCGDVLQLDLPDGVSDLTICNGVIHHTLDPFRAFQELVRITRPGGRPF
jgi:SAM-dependent methyltransferase